jgi:indole-3-acetate monooxygenase
MIGAGARAFTAWLDPNVARGVLPDSNLPGAALFAPTARAVAHGREFSVSGRWPFASGCRHAEWFLNGVIVFDGDRPRALASGAPDWRMAFLRRADIQVIDNWDVMGLRGTGSNDVAGADIRVPEELLIRPFFEAARHDGPLGRLPFFTLAGAMFAGFPLGVGRRALDEFTHIARTRGRAANQSETIGDDGAAQMALARAEGALRSARAFVFDALGSVWRSACHGDEPTLDQRAELQLAVHQSMRAALEATDMALTFTGASGIRSSHPLQRCFRDLHTANEHMYWSSASIKRYARLRLGLPEATYWV